MPKRDILIILGLSAIITVLLQFNFTAEIIFRGYATSSDFMVGGDRAYYLALINESSKGQWNLGNPFNREWRDAPYLYPALNLNFPGLLKRIFGLDIKSTAILMDYGIVFILMILILSMFLVALRFNSWAYLAALTYIFFPPRMIPWARTVSPQINFLPLLCFFIFYFSELKFWQRQLGLGFFASLLFYTYPFHWTFVLPLLFISDFLVCWRDRKFKAGLLYKYFLITALSSYYFWHLFEIQKLPYYEESMRRIGLLYSYWPAGWYTQAAILGALILFWIVGHLVLGKIDWRRTDFLNVTSGLLASLAVLNTPLITGMQMELNSHYFPVTLIFFIIFFYKLVPEVLNLLPKYEKVLKYLLVVGAAVWISAFIAGMVAGYASANPFSKKENHLNAYQQELVKWFKDRGIKNSVVYAPPELSEPILLLTDNYLFFYGSQELQLMPTAEIIDRFTYFDITNQEVTDFPENYHIQIFGHTFESVMQKDNVLNKIKAKILGRNFIPATLAEYTKYDFESLKEKRRSASSGIFVSKLDQYQVQYLIYKKEDAGNIYFEVPGNIVFENDFYIMKERLTNL